MQLRGQMHRALAIDGVPGRRIGHTVELGLKADLPTGLIRGEPHHVGRGLPGGPAGRAPHHLAGANFALAYGNLKLGQAKAPAILTQALRPGQGASDGGTLHLGQAPLFARGHHGDIPLTANVGQFVG